MKTIKIDCSDDTQLYQAKSLITANPNLPLTLDLSKFNFFFPEHLTHTRCLFDLAKKISMPDVSIEYPLNSDAKNYSGRIGLYKDTEYQYPFTEHGSTKFFPLYKINSDLNEDLIDQFVSIFSNLNIPQNYCRDIAETFSEVADNVYFHSGNSYKTGEGYACAQIINGKIYIAVCDIGIGFYNSYKNNDTLKGRSEEQVLRDSIEELVSSLKDPVRGIGLFQAKELIQQYGNSLEIITGNLKLRVSKSDISVQKLDIPFDGAIIKMEIPVV